MKTPTGRSRNKPKKQTTPPKPQRGTDEAFYQLMQFNGQSILKLLGVPEAQAKLYQFHALNIKDKRILSPDISGFPVLEYPDVGRYFIEFQGYQDAFIHHRLIAEIYFLCQHTSYSDPVHAAIIYTDQKCKDKAKTLNTINDNLFGKNLFKEIVLTDYTEAELIAIDAKLIVLAPFTLADPNDKPVVTQHMQRWKTILKSACTEQQYPHALNLLGIFLFNRCRHFTYEEIYNMLNINLMDSRAGQDIFAMGKQEGLQEGRQKGLQQGIYRMIMSTLEVRFGEVSATLKQHINIIESEEILMQLHKQALLCQNLSEFERYLDD